MVLSRALSFSISCPVFTSPCFSPIIICRRFWPGDFSGEYERKRPCSLVRRRERRNCRTGCVKSPSLACRRPAWFPREVPTMRTIYQSLAGGKISIGSCGLIILSDLEETLRHPVIHFEDGGFRFMALREEPLENPLNRFAKRLIDIIVSGFVLLFVFPIAAIVIWITQRLQSPGSLFHNQVRAGIQNRRFTIYKFRTMRPDGGRVADQARDHDDRIYPLGRFFRKFSIDEIPQFWNVLRGEMSIVGPRPHLLEHNAEFARVMAGYNIRAFVKPGITGLAQVRGFRGEARDNSAIENRVACDLEYLENWNLSLEIGIILRTVAQLFLPPQTAY
ncbi:MAG: hypothetical protein DME32_06040 [Verrucomicrobia bacterium]|nr:MAG: hypothetical protein DME32_06040 [Verrucomicrobiota bacterium]